MAVFAEAGKVADAAVFQKFLFLARFDFEETRLGCIGRKFGEARRVGQPGGNRDPTDGASRFGRGLVRPGGTLHDVDDALAATLKGRLAEAMRDLTSAVELMFGASTVTARFEGTGTVDRESCEAIGMVGPAARASGVDRDVRRDHPGGIYRFAHVPVVTAHHGDVNSRAFVRWLEAQRSADFVSSQLAALPKGPVRAALKPIRPGHVAVALVEGWRGEVAHVAVTDGAGRFSRYKVVDPSFHNWFGLALALRNEEISDFPLCNKSFNLSYCGHDL